MFTTRSASIAAKRGSAAILVGHVPAVGRRASQVARTLQRNAEKQSVALQYQWIKVSRLVLATSSTRCSHGSLVTPQFGSPDATSSTGTIPTETTSSTIQLPGPSAGQYTIDAGLPEEFPGPYSFNSAGTMGQAAYGYSDSVQALAVPAQAIPPIAFPPMAEYPGVQSGAARMVLPSYHSSQNEVGSWTNEGHPAGGNHGAGSGGFEALPESDFQSSASDHQFPWGQTRW